MKRLFLSTTALALAGGMASADVAVTGSAEMGVKGSKGTDAQLHRDIRVVFGLSGSTDTGLTFGATAKLEHGVNQRSDKESVHISGAFGTLTLGDTNGAFDQALTEVGSGGAIADDHTSHPGYDGNSGLAGSVNNPNTLRYDYSLGDITTSVSGEFGATDSNNSVLGAGVAWSGDVGGIGIGVGVGYETGRQVGMADSSISGASVSVDMGNGISFVVNSSRKDADGTKTSHNGVGVAYTAGDLTIGVNGGQKKHKGATNQNDSGAGFAAVYSLGTGVSFQVGAGSGKEGAAKTSSWSAGLAFSF